MKSTKKIISLLLSLLMIVSTLPMTAITASAEVTNIASEATINDYTPGTSNSTYDGHLNCIKDGRKGYDGNNESYNENGMAYYNNTNSWPHKSTSNLNAYANFTWTEAKSISEAKVYFWSDSGGTKMPSSFKIRYSSDGVSYNEITYSNSTTTMSSANGYYTISTKDTLPGNVASRVVCSTFDLSSISSEPIQYMQFVSVQRGTDAVGLAEIEIFGETYSASTDPTISGTMTLNNYGLIRGGSTSRLDGGVFNIVNDQEANNTSAGIIKFQIPSTLSSYQVTEAKLNAQIDSYDSEKLDTSFYYSIDNSKCESYVDGASHQVSLSAGTGTTGRDSCLSALGSSTSKLIGTITKSDTSVNTFDIADALNDAIANGKQYLYVIIVKTSAGTQGSGSAGGWSDTKVTPSKQSITYKADKVSSTQAEINQLKSVIDTKILLWNGYTGGATGYIGTTTATNAYSNLLYCSQTVSSNMPDNRNINNWTSLYVKFVNPETTVMLYDGVTQPSRPIIGRAGNWCSSGTALYLYYAYPCVNSNSTSPNANFELNKNWDATDSTSDFSDQEWRTSYISQTMAHTADDSANPLKYTTQWNASKYVGLYNRLYYKTSNPNTTNYYEKYTSLPIRYRAYCGSDTPRALYYTIESSDHTDYVVNYKPIKDQVTNVKVKYSNIKANEANYCPSQLKEYYEAVKKVIELNPNDGKYAYASNTESAVQSVAGDIKDIVDNYLTLAKNGPAGHIWNAGEITTPATCTATGIKTFTCTTPDCGATKEETVATSGHTWGSWVDGGATSGHTRKCQNCDTWSAYEAHNSNTKIDGTPATCTQAGITDGYKCSECGRIMVAQTTENAKGHNYIGSVTDENHATYTCANDASHSYTVDIEAYNNIVKVAEDAIANAKIYDSVSGVETALANNSFDINNVETQDTVDAKVTAIQSAVNALTSKEFAVNVVYYDTNGKVLDTDTASATYGEEITLKADDKYSVIKWVRNYKASDLKVATTSQYIKAIITSDTTYKVTVNDLTESANPSNIAVKLYNKSNRLVDVAYIPAGEYDVTVDVSENTLNIGTYKLVAPSVVFYTLNGFKINGTSIIDGKITISQETNIMVSYAPTHKNINVVCDDTCTANVEKAAWNQLVKVTAKDGNANTKWIVNGDVVSYGETYSFYATTDVNITCSNEAVAAPVATVLSLDYNTVRENAITAVGTFYIPDGYIKKDAGVLLKTTVVNDTAAVGNRDNYTGENGATVTAKKFVATQFVEGTNQFVINVSSATPHDEIFIGAVAFVTVTDMDGNNEQTFYSPIKTLDYHA